METIRVKTDGELKQCLVVRRAVFIEEQGVSEELEIDEYDASPLSCHHLLIVKDGQPVAAGRLKVYERNMAKLQRIAVLKHARGMGIGRRILTALEQLAKELGFTHTILDAQLQAENFYKKAGYSTVSEETFMDAGILHVRMKKNLHKV